MPRYDARRIEAKWQAYWDERQTFVVSGIDPGKPKLYVLDMFPYPSGDGLHVGHPEGYTATDITCRYARMRGKQVLHPMGWDAFGLPAEEHAIKTGTHPRIKTEQNIDTFRRQLKMLGFSYDWSRELSTTDPDYFRWTQWIFLQVFNSWFDEEAGRARPIDELPIPAEVQSQGNEAVRRYQDGHRLAYQHEAPVNWCPALGTVLANEEVIDGKSDVGGHPVERLPLRQWMLRITAYAERLIDDLAPLDWPESIKIQQRNWIGRSEGAEVDFYIGGGFDRWKASRAKSGYPAEAGDDVLRIYTTRPDTLFGATYMVIAPEHPYVAKLTTEAQRPAVEAYCRKAALKSDLDRTDLAKEKTGVFTGSYAVNPVNGEQVPIWIADYVLISYGTGAIMAVPAHDLRDWEFAIEFELPIIPVVRAPEGYVPSKEERALGRKSGKRKAESGGEDGGFEFPFAEYGTAINSGNYNGLPTAEFKQKITADLAAGGLGRKAVNYRLRDWLFSRQRYWGEPFPIWHELDVNGEPTGLMRSEPVENLPVQLPDMADFKPTGTPEPMLSKAPADWLYKTAADGVRLKRETNSMPQWAGSCWYYIRFCDPKNSERFIDPEKEKYWLPVDLYVGGAEHAVLHLLYARFWHKVLYDLGHVSTPEPFQRLVNQGMILGEAELTGWKTPSGEWISIDQTRDGTFKETGEELVSVKLAAEQVEKKGDRFLLKDRPEIAVESRAFKMSKSRGNVINPDDIVKQYGADSLRLYEMFMGPLEQVKPWSMSGVEGVFRFLARVWRMFVDDRADDVALHPAVQNVEPNEAQLRVLYRTIKAVGDDIEKLSFNTAISRMMEFTNEFSQQEPRPRKVLEPFVLLLAPFAPHLAEELWQLLSHTQSLACEPWPAYDAALLMEAEVELPVQVNGKVRGKIRVPAAADADAIEAIARADEAVARNLEGKTVAKVIVIPGRTVNFVVKK